MFEILDFWVAILFGIVALVILGYDLYMRRKIMDSELSLQKEKSKRDKDEREEWQNWLAKERVELSKLSTPLSELISEELIKNSDWAVKGIKEANLGPYSKTLFGSRSKHYSKEKEKIASMFVPLLLSRCKRLIQTGKHIYLVIDSGTTLRLLFKLLGEKTVQFSADDEKWIDKLTIVTNNLSGIQSLMEHGRPNPNNRYSGLAVDCRLLPGVPLPVYSAVTGEETEKALRELHSNTSDSNNSIFIGITTGNWVRIRKSEPRCPVPLGRGKGHLAFKQTLLNVSDEVFVISPLGKIFANASNENVNHLLGFSGDIKDPERKSYDELDINSEKASSVKLVTTSRKKGRLLDRLSTCIKVHLRASSLDEENAEKFRNAKVGETESVVGLFDDLPRDEKEIEFPHGNTWQNEEFIEHFSNP